MSFTLYITIMLYGFRFKYCKFIYHSQNHYTTILLFVLHILARVSSKFRDNANKVQDYHYFTRCRYIEHASFASDANTLLPVICNKVNPSVPYQLKMITQDTHVLIKWALRFPCHFEISLHSMNRKILRQSHIFCQLG